jgi:plastocyanin
MSRCSVVITAAVTAALLLSPGRQASGYEVVTVSDGGTIHGKVTFTGPPPPPRKEIRTKNPDVCGSGVFEVPQMDLAANKAVGEAVVYLKGVEKGGAWEKLAKSPEVVNHKCSFVPHVQAVPVGTDIVVVNSDNVLHNTHAFLNKLTVFNLAMPNLNQRIPKPLKRPGLVKVECDAHGWMLGWVYVADNPYYAMTGKDGSFTLKDVPPGSYTLVIWQEFTGPVEMPVTVKGKGVESVTVDLAKK